MDYRYEVRDAQFFAGELADAGLVTVRRSARQVAPMGAGSPWLSARSRTGLMMPDGSLVPWTEPGQRHPDADRGRRPVIPWRDLAYSLTPNGGTLDYAADSPYSGRTGIEKSLSRSVSTCPARARAATAARRRTPRPARTSVPT